VAGRGLERKKGRKKGGGIKGKRKQFSRQRGLTWLRKKGYRGKDLIRMAKKQEEGKGRKKEGEGGTSRIVREVEQEKKKERLITNCTRRRGA